MTRQTRRLAAIMFTDIVGYTALMGESEEKAVRARERHRVLVKDQVEQSNGEWIEETGDASLSCFPSALDAANCALAIQAALRDDPDLKLRIGIHLGDVVFEAGRIYGDGVNVASRLQPLAEPGGICVSGEVYRSLKNQPGIEASPMGERELKNVDRPVSVFEMRGKPAETPVGRGAETQSSGLWRNWPLVLGAFLFVLLVIGGVRWWAGRVRIPLPTPIRSLAVLPLENLSGDPEQEYFADGMTEALIGDLAKIGSLRVISRTSVMQYKAVRKPLPEIAKELSVDAVVEGTVLREGDRVRITAQLIDARNDAHLWAERYDRNLRDILNLQSEVARTIARQIEIKLTPEEGERLSPARQIDPDAHEAYLKGRYYWNRRTVASGRKAIEYFGQAIEFDREYAPAHAGIADSYWLLAVYGERPRDVGPRGKAAAERALQLDDTLAEAHASLAAILLWYDWDLLEAEKEFKRAIELNPSYAPAHQWYSNLLMYLGRSEEGLAEARLCLQLDPLSLIANTTLGINYYYARQYDDATKQLRATLEMDPHFLPAHLWLGLTYAQRSMYREAATEFQAAKGLGPAHGFLGYVYALQGREDEARKVEEELWERSRHGYVPPAAFVWLYTAMGETEQALAWLEEAYEERDVWGLAALIIDPAADPLRSEPRFQELMRELGLPSPGAGA